MNLISALRPYPEIALLLLIYVLSSSVKAQTPNVPSNLQSSEESILVPLAIHVGVVQPMYRGVPLPSQGSGPIEVTLPGGLSATVTRAVQSSPQGVGVKIANAEPGSLLLVPGQKSLLSLDRAVGGEKAVPYLLGYERWERDGETRERLTWQPVYRAEGKLKLPGCEVTVYVLDFNGDGRFDEADSKSATTLGLDLNTDGRLWGASEYNKMSQIVEVCGIPLEVAGLDPVGGSITFKRSQIRPLAIGDTLPEFTLATTAGRTLRSSDFRRRVHVLDFWASWCAPCVEKLHKLDEIARASASEVHVVGVNVDDADRRLIAERLIAEKALSFPQVIRGLGDEDFLWKMFGSMSGIRLSIPLYVVIDLEGRISYAGGGGDDLQELSKAIQAAKAEK